MEAMHLPAQFEHAIQQACFLVPEFAHIEPSSILVLVGKLPPTRLGDTVGLRPDKQFAVEGRPIRYVMRFSARLVKEHARAHDALDTVMHELWHIGPQCDGNIRAMRHGETFDAIVRTLRRTYIKAGGEALPCLPNHTTIIIRTSHRRTSGFQERKTTLGRLVPPTILYECPLGHTVVRHRRLSRPSSCASCAPRFDMRFLLKEKTTT